MSNRNHENPLVYSTQSGRHCPNCGEPIDCCTCGVRTPNRGRILVKRESKGRRGKTVTLISGLPLTDAELHELASKIKQSLGTGGAVKEGQILIQGDHVAFLKSWLQKRGLTSP